MGQLLAVLIVPPIVGLVTYFVVRLLWERDENGANKDHFRNGVRQVIETDEPLDYSKPFSQCGVRPAAVVRPQRSVTISRGPRLLLASRARPHGCHGFKSSTSGRAVMLKPQSLRPITYGP
jgi:hypothetical protein